MCDRGSSALGTAYLIDSRIARPGTARHDFQPLSGITLVDTIRRCHLARRSPLPMTQEEAAGIRVVLSPVQLAAVLADDSVSEDATWTNRLWGGLQLVGGVAELAGAGVLCLAPEPTMASKVGCVVFGAHGADTTAAGARQIRSGRDIQSLTHSGTAALATALGASPGTAHAIGMTVDIAVPFAVAGWVGAARVASIRAGRISLLQHEAQAGSRLGGHTILKHVGKTETELRARLAAERDIKAASSFTTLGQAERAISSGLHANANRIQAWARGAGTGAGRFLVIVHDGGSVIGQTVPRLSNQLRQTSKIQIVLKLETYNNMPYYILTAFPTL